MIFVSLGIVLAGVLLACAGLYVYAHLLNLRIRWRNWRKARRASRVRHINVGGAVWEPSKEELDNLSAHFMQAGKDESKDSESPK